MSRWKKMLGALLCMLLLPSPGKNLSSLRPAECLYVYKDGKDIVVETDQGDKGKGETWQHALTEMRETSPGIVYLDTAQLLMLEAGTEYLLKEYKETLRPNVHVCVADGNVDVEKATEYLRVHKPLIELGKMTLNTKAQILTWDGEKIRIADE